jgi:UPF0176 protein
MFTVAALYHFTRFEDPAEMQAPLQQKCHELGITGSLLLAKEGINGTIAGSKSGYRRHSCASKRPAWV